MSQGAPVWEPQYLQQVLELYHKSVSDTCTNEDHRHVLEQHERLQVVPDYANYLTLILAEASLQLPEQIRQMAGLHLKAFVKRAWSRVSPPVRAYVKARLVQCISDPSPIIRATVANIVSHIVVADGLATWPMLTQSLLLLLDSNAPAPVFGALLVLRHLCEDCAQQMDQEDAGRPATLFIPRFLKFCYHTHVDARRDALYALNQFLLVLPTSLAMNAQKYVEALFRLASDDSTEIRRLVCQAFVSLVEHRIDWIAPHIESIMQFVISCNGQTQDEKLAIDACDFWGVYASRDGADAELLFRQLGQLLPILLDRMCYTEEDLADLDDGDDANEPDREEDIAPRFHTSRTANFHDDDDDDDDDDDFYDSELDDDFADWNLRKASASALDSISAAFGERLVPLLVQNLDARLKSENWLIQESSILALGAVAEGCYDGLVPQLPLLVPFLVQLLRSQRALVRAITCWAIGRYSTWITQHDHGMPFFKPVLEGLLMRILDRNKKVQEAACCALATFEERAQDKLLPYLRSILETLMRGFAVYQLKNIRSLYDALGALAETVGPAMQESVCVQLVMPTLMNRWNKMHEHDRTAYALMECLTAVAMALQHDFSPYASPIYVRCWALVRRTMYQAFQAEQAQARGEAADRPDKEIVVCALDLLSGMAEGLGTSFEALVATNTEEAMDTLLQCVSDQRNHEVRQSAFALLGDVAKTCMPRIRRYIPQFLPLCARNLYPGWENVCNNASWAIGEIAIKIGPDIEPYVDVLLKELDNVHRHDNGSGNLADNTAITIGRICLVAPEQAARWLPKLGGFWLSDLEALREDGDKEHAFQGLCNVVGRNPHALIGHFGAFLAAIASWEKPPQKLGEAFVRILASYKQLVQDKWGVLLASCKPEIVQKLVQMYHIPTH